MMKLYNAPMPAPNPRRVRMFLAEKGPQAIAAVELVPVDLMRGAHKAPEHLARNSLGQLPTLELEDGTTISETVAICRYLESVFPDPPLFGRTPLEQAQVEMWTRRVELQLGGPARMFWMHAHPFTSKVVVPQYKEFGDSNRAHYAKALTWLDGELKDRLFIAGAELSIADLCAVTIIDFAEWTGLAAPEGLAHVVAWRTRMAERPSASA